MLETIMALALTSSAFTHNGPIPRQYTCQGGDVSVPIAWTGIPEAAKSLALIVDDPDAPDPAAPKRTWVHWVLYNLPVTADGLKQAVKATELPAGTLPGKNDWGRTGYGGPCPPIGRHRYFFKLHALDTILPNLAQPTKAELERAMDGHVLERFELVGTYQKD
jgi:Raf kinase inhibitor-like YbhB/YbcL family protein